MPAALVRIDVFELSHADGEGGGVGALRQRCGGRSREQRREQERFDDARHVVIAHVAVLSCT
jgi:hypothetical protein